MTTLNIRMDEKLKKNSAKICDSLGMDMSTAVRMFFNQMLIEKGLPFKPKRTPAEIRKEWDKEIAEALKGKGYTSVRKMHDDILKSL